MTRRRPSPALVVATDGDRGATIRTLGLLLRRIEGAVAGLAADPPTTLPTAPCRPATIAEWRIADTDRRLRLDAFGPDGRRDSLALVVDGAGGRGATASIRFTGADDPVLGRAARSAREDPAAVARDLAAAARRCLEALRAEPRADAEARLAGLRSALATGSADAAETLSDRPCRHRTAWLATPWTGALVVALVDVDRHRGAPVPRLDGTTRVLVLADHHLATALPRFDATTMGVVADVEGRTATLSAAGVAGLAPMDPVDRLRLQPTLDALPVVDHGDGA